MTLDIAKAYQTIYDTYASLPDELDPQGNNRLTTFQNFILYLRVPHILIAGSQKLVKEKS